MFQQKLEASNRLKETLLGSANNSQVPKFQKNTAHMREGIIDSKFEMLEFKLKESEEMRLDVECKAKKVLEENEELRAENLVLKRKLKKYHGQCQDLTAERSRLMQNFQKIEEELNQMTLQNLASAPRDSAELSRQKLESYDKIIT